MNCALPPVLLSLNWVSAPLFVVMVALPAVLLLLNDNTAPLLFVMTAFPAELVPLKFRVSLLIKLGANAELLTMPRRPSAMVLEWRSRMGDNCAPCHLAQIL